MRLNFMTTVTQDFLDLADVLLSAPVRERIWSKVCQDLQEYFIKRAVSTPAWPRSTSNVETFVASWLPPGNYTLNELQDRFAPRHQDDPRTPDPMYQIIASRTIETVSGMLKTLLILPEQEELVKAVAAEGVDMDTLHEKVLLTLGQPLCTQIAKEVGSTDIVLNPDYLRDAGLRRVLAEVAAAQERQHEQRSRHASRERYVQLLKDWQNYSGDAYGVRIETDSELAKELAEWLATLTVADAAIFLTHHNVSAELAAGQGMAPELREALANPDTLSIPAPYPKVYTELRQLISTIMAIRGYRRLTVTTNDEKFVRIDIDQFNRIGIDELHMGYFVNLLLTGLLAGAGVMVRAFQAETINVFSPEKGAFTQIALKNMYGALLDQKSVKGLTARQVLGAMTRDPKTGETIPREASIRCLDWPTMAGTSAAGAASGPSPQ
jgi:hypothetical protein